MILIISNYLLWDWGIRRASNIRWRNWLIIQLHVENLKIKTCWIFGCSFTWFSVLVNGCKWIESSAAFRCFQTYSHDIPTFRHEHSPILEIDIYRHRSGMLGCTDTGLRSHWQLVENEASVSWLAVCQQVYSYALLTDIMETGTQNKTQLSGLSIFMNVHMSYIYIQ